MNMHTTDIDVTALFNKGIEEQKTGNLDTAIKIYDEIINIKPDHCMSLHNKACVLVLQNELIDALKAFEGALNLNPNVGLYWINYIKTLVGLDRIAEAKALIVASKTSGLFCKDMKALSLKIDKEHREPSPQTTSEIDELINQKRFFSAIDKCKDLLVTYPKSALLHFALGQCYCALDQMEMAIANYTKATKYMPKSAINFLMLSRAYTSNGDTDKAIENLNKAIRLKPNEYEIYFEIGMELYEKCSFDAAIKCFKNTIKLRPNFAPAYFALGLLELELGKADKAVAYSKQVLAIKPDYAEAYITMGKAFEIQLKLDEAISYYRKAIFIKNDCQQAYEYIGNVLRKQDNFCDAISAYSKAIEIQSDYTAAYVNLSEIYVIQNRYDLAIENLENLLRLKPELEMVRAQRLFYQAQICDWRAITKDRHLLPNLGISKETIAPFTLSPLEDAPKRHRLRAELYAKFRFNQTALKLEHKPSQKTARIRVGYFSSDFYNHATMALMSQVFALHDKARFEVIIYSYGVRKDNEITEKLMNNVNIFHDVSEMTDRQIVEMARSEKLDLAIDLKGYTEENRLELFAYGLAPVQISHLGYPGTLGTKFIDYFIADPVLIPEDKRDYYSEKIIYLPNSYQPNDNKRFISDKAITREEAELPIDSFVFCCFNDNYKITPKEFDIWMRLLNKVEGSVLWLLRSNSSAEMNMKREAVARGIDAERLVFAEKMPHAEHLARHRLADLFLDTFNVNAHTTASDALWAGLPIITKLGENFAARVAGSLLNAVGLPELITENESDYEALILDLSTNPKRLDEIKRKLADNLLSKPLFDTQKYTNHLETAYEQAFETYRKGRPPEVIIVPN